MGIAVWFGDRWRAPPARLGKGLPRLGSAIIKGRLIHLAPLAGPISVTRRVRRQHGWVHYFNTLSVYDNPRNGARTYVYQRGGDTAYLFVPHHRFFLVNYFQAQACRSYHPQCAASVLQTLAEGFSALDFCSAELLLYRAYILVPSVRIYGPQPSHVRDAISTRGFLRWRSPRGVAPTP